MSQQHCHNCGSPLIAGDMFCQNCGTAVTLQASVQYSVRKSRVKLVAIIAIFCAGAVLGFAAFFAVNHFRNSNGSSPPVPDDDPTAEYYIDLGDRYLSDGDYNKAIIAYTSAIEIDKKNVDAYIGRADSYVALEDYEDAIADYERAVELNDRLVDVYLKLADIYIELGNTEKAIETLKRGFEATGDSRIEEKLDEITMTVSGSITHTGESPQPAPVGEIKILSVTPDKITEKQSTEFSVTVQYSSSRTESCIISLGANTEESGVYVKLFEQIVDGKGGTVTLTFQTIPVLWSNASFGISAVLDAYPRETGRPLLASAVFDVEVIPDMYSAYLDVIADNQTYFFESEYRQLSGGGLLDFDNDGVADLVLQYNIYPDDYGLNPSVCVVFSFKDGDIKQLFSEYLGPYDHSKLIYFTEKDGSGFYGSEESLYNEYDQPEAAGYNTNAGIVNTYSVYSGGELREVLRYSVNTFVVAKNSLADQSKRELVTDHVTWKIYRNGQMTQSGIVANSDSDMPEIDAVKAEAKSTYGNEWRGMSIDQLKAKLEAQ